MSENTAIYDLGEIHRGRRRTPSTREAASSSMVAQASALPGVAASMSLFVPGAGHLVLRELQAALFFSSAIGCCVAVGWAIWQIMTPLLPTLGWLEIPRWTVAVAFASLYAAAAALHVLSVLDAHGARLRACLPRTAHPILAALASAVVPGWGQVLVGKRGRAALFLSMLWVVGAGWILALPVTRETLARLRLRLPFDPEQIDRVAPVALLVATGIVWGIAVWDAAATRRRR